MNAQAQAPALPDVNAETYPYEYVQHLLDQTANLSLYAIPDPSYRDQAGITPYNPGDFFGINGGYGIDLRSVLHRFDSSTFPSTLSRSVEVEQTIGENVGVLRGRCMFGPDDLGWTPGHEPPPAIFDPWRSQKFALVDTEVSFGEEQRFKGYGVGRTFPQVFDGKPVIFAGAVGNVTEGSGRFRGHNGTFVMTGFITEDLGFQGNITCRIVDPQDRFQTDREIYPLSARSDPDPQSRYLVMRGIKRDRNVRTSFGPPPGGDLVSLITPSQMRSVQLGFSHHGLSGPVTSMRVGQVVAEMEADVAFNLMAPPGTAQHPVPFTTDEIYRFLDADGETVGTISAGVVQGISFDLKFPAAPGQPGVRFAGFGPITGGTGQFEGAKGMLTVNSLIGIAPHVLSLLHVLHLFDPQRRTRNGCAG
jgi:hypothetical protein